MHAKKRRKICLERAQKPHQSDQAQSSMILTSPPASAEKRPRFCGISAWVCRDREQPAKCPPSYFGGRLVVLSGLAWNILGSEVNLEFQIQGEPAWASWLRRIFKGVVGHASVRLLVALRCHHVEQLAQLSLVGDMAVSIFRVEEHIQVTRGVAVFGFDLLLLSCFATSRKFSGVIPVMDFTRIDPPLGFGSAFTASCFVSLSVGSDSADTCAGAVSLASSGLAAVMALATTHASLL